MTQPSVIIVGAGPAGSVLAGLLARYNVDTLLLDKATFPRQKTCGDYLNPGTVRLLTQLGLLTLVCEAGAQRLWGMTVASPDGTTFRAKFPAVVGSHTSPFALSIPRATLDGVLLEWAQESGARCVEGFRATDLIWENEQVCGVTGIGPKGWETYRGQIVVGADGRDSMVARRLGLRQPHPTLHRTALVAYYEGPAELVDYGLISIGVRSYCILNPIGKRLVNASIVVDHGLVRGWMGHIDELFDVMFQEFPLAVRALSDTQRAGPIRCLGPLAFRASRNAKAGALLIGDAAGFYDPFTGEGVGRALASAEFAAREITSGLSEGEHRLTEARLTRFDRRQRAAFKSRTRLSVTLQTIIRHPLTANLVARLLRRRQSVADLVLGVVGDLLPPRVLIGIPLRNLRDPGT